MSKKEILKYLLEINTDMTVSEILFCLMMSLLLGIIIYEVYKITFSGTVYSNDFNTLLVLMVIITTSIMMVIGSNLALSLGLVGSLSIIRFRSAIKEPRDMIFIFWAIADGLACGAEIFSVGFISTFVIAVVVIVMSKRNKLSSSFLLIVRGKVNIEELESRLNNSVKRWKLKMRVLGDDEEITYEIQLGTNKPDALLEDVRKMDGIVTINLVSYNGELMG